MRPFKQIMTSVLATIFLLTATGCFSWPSFFEEEPTFASNFEAPQQRMAVYRLSELAYQAALDQDHEIGDRIEGRNILFFYRLKLEQLDHAVMVDQGILFVTRDDEAHYSARWIRFETDEASVEKLRPYIPENARLWQKHDDEDWFMVVWTTEPPVWGD